MFRLSAYSLFLVSSLAACYLLACFFGLFQKNSRTHTSMAALQPLKTITVSPLAKHTATIIFVHGLGDTGNGWKPVADMFSADTALQHIKWILPTAPSMKITANMGMEMPAWFDIAEFGLRTTEDEKGMLNAMHALNKLITAEVDSGIPANRIVLGGFSQGAAMSLLTGLTTERKLAGVAVLSGWVPMRNKFKAMTSEHAKSVPVFWGHGKRDPLVKFQIGEASARFLQTDIGIATAATDTSQNGLSFHAYDDLPHSASEEELDDLKAWLKKILPRDP
ncbi:Acyl-protein thioesterase 1 [Grifola frondosa]|uniref:Acyl-protein thioesterase 1 n=1 Tax=Grifola frondosa TaxID=5627 RepID=A0A1C7LZU1_GRIFR|nr:Acyl-protein thioesterase 1 [Grifola frondosa]